MSKRETRRDALTAELADGISRLSTTAEWQEFLNFQARLHTYSFANTLLILRQCPEASVVMGFGNKAGTTGWKSAGRQVRKGEQAIWIWGPSFRARDEGEDGEERTLRGFVPVPVFDVSQTDGEPLPEPAKLLQGEDPDGVLIRCATYIDSLGYTVEFVPSIPGGAHGDTTWDLKRVRLATDGRSPLQQAKTALHEAGHILCGHQDKMPRDLKELEAESAAYVAAQTLGLETSEYSFGYVLSWMQGDAGKARDAIKASGSRIQKAAGALIDGISALRIAAATAAA